MICTSCGSNNTDDARACENCGRKLQSFFTVPDQGPGYRDLPRLRISVVGLNGAFLRKCLEAWAVLLLVLGAVGYGAVTEDWRPTYAVLPIALLTAWKRGL